VVRLRVPIGSLPSSVVEPAAAGQVLAVCGVLAL
jgi:hypothetical protein